ncbi:olfactory receptor 6B9-like [Eleutherodactylus coqui]|uniref:olfactory receptor 6B9-like n=1 Tax=Eleutherodactylus coqui TaxID=57060 RepID=UPI0034626B59
MSTLTSQLQDLVVVIDDLSGRMVAQEQREFVHVFATPSIPGPKCQLPECNYYSFYTQENNLTSITEFFLLGFQISQYLRYSLFLLFLVVYCGTICGNLLIITLVSTSKTLHTPMYFFISQLSFGDILVITDIVPNMLHILLNNGATITFISCITQLYFLCASEAFECFLLTVMAYDRYVAICNPLHYSTIMTSGHCVILTITCWLLGFSIILIYIIKTAKLIFCGPNIIDHLFCDIVPLLDLACSDTFVIHLEIYFMGIPIVIFPTTIIVASYSYIVLAILRIPSSTGRQKAFSTCSSHLIVVSIFYWTMFSVYVVPSKGLTLSISKVLSLLYTVFTPLINPIIYSLRNKDIKKAIKQGLYNSVIWYKEHLRLTAETTEEEQAIKYLLFVIYVDLRNFVAIPLTQITSKYLHYVK